MIEEIKNIPNSNKDIKSFGITIGIILFIISGLLMYYNKDSCSNYCNYCINFHRAGFNIPNLFKANLFCVDDICSDSWLGND